MQLEHSFTVPVGVDEAWKILLDIERVGPCLPGATVDSVDGDDFTGSVKVKLGPINLTYKGKASFVEKDDTAHRAKIDASGRDARGNGTAHAVVTATLTGSGSATDVKVETDLDITGKPAQFGRGVMVDVGNKLIGQFADCLSRTLTGAGEAVAPAAPAAAAVETEAATKPPAAKKAPRPRPARTGEPVGTAATAAAAEGAAATEPPTEPPADPPANPRAADETTPSYSVPGGVPDAAPAAVGSVNGHATRETSEAAGEVEPINLLESAGPAVAKRLAPVALAFVLLLGALRRRRRARA